MAFNVADFKATVRDIARQYQFAAEIIFPTAVPGGTSDLVNILAESTGLPGRKLDPIAVPFMGMPYNVIGKASYKPWDVTFRVDDNLDVYKKFRAWSELVIGTETNLAAFPAQYKSAPVLYQLDTNGNKIASYTLNGAWVSNVGELAYDTTKRDLITVAVTFTYDVPVFAVM